MANHSSPFHALLAGRGITTITLEWGCAFSPPLVSVAHRCESLPCEILLKYGALLM